MVLDFIKTFFRNTKNTGHFMIAKRKNMDENHGYKTKF